MGAVLGLTRSFLIQRVLVLNSVFFLPFELAFCFLKREKIIKAIQIIAKESKCPRVKGLMIKRGTY
jgi:penicillin-binding protein-related factor A (putative recombinase)